MRYVVSSIFYISPGIEEYNWEEFISLIGLNYQSKIFTPEREQWAYSFTLTKRLLEGLESYLFYTHEEESE